MTNLTRRPNLIQLPPENVRRFSKSLNIGCSLLLINIPAVNYGRE